MLSIIAFPGGPSCYLVKQAVFSPNTVKIGLPYLNSLLAASSLNDWHWVGFYCELPNNAITTLLINNR
jgi:hypothetical protein